MTIAATALAVSVLAAAPAMPSPSNDPQPKTSSGHSTRCMSAVASSISDGSSMLPAPRTTPASTLVDQITTAPANRTFE